MKQSRDFPGFGGPFLLSNLMALPFWCPRHIIASARFPYSVITEWTAPRSTRFHRSCSNSCTTQTQRFPHGSTSCRDERRVASVETAAPRDTPPGLTQAQSSCDRQRVDVALRRSLLFREVCFAAAAADPHESGGANSWACRLCQTRVDGSVQPKIRLLDTRLVRRVSASMMVSRSEAMIRGSFFAQSQDHAAWTFRSRVD